MRQIWITKRGGPGVLEVREAPDPHPQAGEVRIRVKACGINFADILARKGLYPDAPRLPAVVGYEVSGDVDSVGEGVADELVGKPVLAVTHFGGYSDAVVVPAQQIFEKPSSLGYEEAAALPVIYLTAYQLLVVMGGLKQGESILIHNAGGGVGLAALDIAKKLGAITYGTSSPGKHEFLRERGFDHLINYRNEDWEDALRDLTNGRGVELIIDPIGGRSWSKSYRSLRPTGRLGMYGASALSAPGPRSFIRIVKFLFQLRRYSPIALMNDNRSVFGVNLGQMWRETGKVNSWMRALLDGVSEGWVQPYVDMSFSYDDAASAHQYIEDRRNIGKVVLIP